MMSQTQATNQKTPIVLCFAGHDPSGGAGLQADIEAIASMGAHAATVATCLTVQDTHDVQRLEPVAASLIRDQATCLLQDLPVAAIKIGLLGSVEAASVVAEVLEATPHIPVIFDPVLAAGGGRELASDALLQAIHGRLLPQVTVLTPNTVEAERLSGEADMSRAAAALRVAGCDYVLLTGTHAASGDTVTNTLYGDNLCESFTWPRLPGSYHGSGCTLAASLAALLALGQDLYAAAFEAQQYTWEALQHSWQAGSGQALPNRFFWAAKEGEE
jgi:hydroxymethylpyrimidine/phosphomethylpyrimidine kinase